VIAARRRVLSLLGNKEAMHIVFGSLAPRFGDRPGGYTRILRLAKPRLGDAGTRAILEFVGVRDRAVQRSQAPRIEDEPEMPAPAATPSTTPAAPEPAAECRTGSIAHGAGL
jgi:large subunit ribosomal protein L17